MSVSQVVKALTQFTVSILVPWQESTGEERRKEKRRENGGDGLTEKDKEAGMKSKERREGDKRRER